MAKIGRVGSVAANDDGEQGVRKQRRLRAPVRRDRILEAATQVFGTSGFGAGMGEVAAAAGVHRTVLYYYFPTKDDLLKAVLDVQLTEAVRYLAPVVSAVGDYEPRFRAAVKAVVDFAEAKPEAWKLLFDTAEVMDPELREMRESAWESVIATMTALFARDAATVGLNVEDPATRATGELLLGGVVHLIRWWREHSVEVSREQLEQVLADFLWYGGRGVTEGLVLGEGHPATSK